MALNDGWRYPHRVAPGASRLPVAAYLAEVFPHSDQATWRCRAAAGEVELDGQRVGPEETLRAGQWLVWHRPPWDEPDVPLAFDVLHEDEALLAVAKPAGLPTLPAGGFLAHTLLTRLRARYPEASPVHRLGRFTSGVVLCARTAPVAAALTRQWRTPAVEKVYRARLAGAPPWDRLEVSTPIGPVPHPRLGTVHAADPGGRPAASTFQVLARQGDTAICEVVIATGRPHQIRIHAAWTGHPLTGDPLYGAGGRPLPVDPGLPGDGGYLLHAHRVSLPHPVTGAPLTVTAPLPPALG